MVTLLTTRCNDDEGVTYSLKDVSSRISGFNNPKTGPGAELTLNGSKLLNVQRIFIGDNVVLARNFVSHTESAITFNVPTSVGVYTDGTLTDVMVVFSGAERAFTKIEVIPFQATSSFTPYAAAAGETVTLRGVNLDMVSGVKLGNVNATIVSKTATVLKFTMPVGAPTGKIVLVSEAGESKSASDLTACTGSTSADCTPGLNLNTGFEDGSDNDFTDWTKNNGSQFMSATTTPGEYYRGSRALKVVRDGSLNSGQWRIQVSTNQVTTEVGASYTVYVWAKASGNGAGFRVSLSPDTGFYPGDVAVTTEWQQFSFVVPGDRIQNTATRFVIDMNGTNTCCSPAINFFIDDIKVIKNP